MEIDERGSEGERWIEHRVSTEESGWMVREVLTRSLRFSKQMIKRLVQSDGIRLNGARPYLSNRVAAGSVLTVRLSAGQDSELRPVPMDLDIVYEDADLLVVNKPAGLLVHPTRRSHIRTLAHGLVHHYRQQGTRGRVHPVHRLDRDTTGLVVVAKHPYAHQRLDRQLRARRLKREYLALVHGSMPGESGLVEAPIAEHPEQPHLRVVDPDSGAVAGTHYRVVQRYPNAGLVQLELQTGRTHQIRVHLAHLGHPLIGDEAYGGRSIPGMERQALHAHRIAFVHPLTGDPLVFTAPLPDDFRRAMQWLTEHEHG